MIVLLALAALWLAVGVVALFVDARQSGRTVREVLVDAFERFTG